MPLTILRDADVSTILHSLNRQDVLDIQLSLADALHYYSTSTDLEDNGCCASYQPQRTSLKSKNGMTTLFMPAISNDNTGVKIVTLAAPERPKLKDGDSSASSFSISSLSMNDSTGSSTTLVDSSAGSTKGSTPNDTKPRGSLTLLDSTGTPRALINAEELTGFRTALASTALFNRRKDVHDLLVFGAGLQAYWHIRLALLLRGEEVHHLTIVNRSFERAQDLLRDLFKNYTDLPHPKIMILTPDHKEHDTMLKGAVRNASVIFTTTPSLTPLFPASYLTSTTARVKGRYIAAIGSYKPHMIEIHPDIIKEAVAPHHSHPHHKHAKTGGAIVVDSVESCMKEAGEVIQAGLDGNEVVELGELIMLKRDAHRRREEEEAKKGAESKKHGDEKDGVWYCRRKGGKEQEDGGLTEWLRKGNVIFKCVGIGLMDIVVGSEIVRLADEREIGVKVENF